MQFDFGQNWLEFSQKALSFRNVDQARRSFAHLVQGLDLNGKTFLDVGFGQGLSLLVAAEMGASAVGLDINPKCQEVIRRNASYFSGMRSEGIPLLIGSILDKTMLKELKQKSPNARGYDIVHAWGVLHHTGALWEAVENSMSLVEDQTGSLILAIYNRHWTSPIWNRVKQVYNITPRSLRFLFNYPFGAIICLAILLAKRDNPFRKDRGMDFWYDVVDWLGGYPYEYASVSKVVGYVERRGFRIMRIVNPRVPTGCNEFVFVRPGGS